MSGNITETYRKLEAEYNTICHKNGVKPKPSESGNIWENVRILEKRIEDFKEKDNLTTSPQSMRRRGW